MIRLLRKLLGKRNECNPNGPWLSEITDNGFVVKRRLTAPQIRDPKLLQRILIVTNDRGPFFDDVFWKFEHPDGDFYFPSFYDPCGSLLSFFQELKGLNSEAVIAAMSSTTNNVFVVWDRDAIQP